MIVAWRVFIHFNFELHTVMGNIICLFAFISILEYSEMSADILLAFGH